MNLLSEKVREKQVICDYIRALCKVQKIGSIVGPRKTILIVWEEFCTRKIPATQIAKGH